MIIGLAGKSCSGKNYVGKLLEAMGLLVWDMDVMCHDGLYENLNAVVSAFGPQVVSEVDGKVVVSRPEIGKVVFRDPSKRTELEGILYPWLKDKVLTWKAQNPDGVLVINGALLYRSGFDALCDAVIYVDASYEVRFQRVLCRDSIPQEAFDRREASQTDVDYRAVNYRAPLYLVTNNGCNLDELNRQVFSICDKLGIIRY